MNIRSKQARIVAAGICVVVATAVAVIVVFASRGQHSGGSAQLILNKGSASAVTYNLETAATPAAQEKGLSGRAGLAPNTGMLFSYQEVGKRCMWMKDMRFNLDIVWLDSTDRIISLVSNLNPSTYPQEYCANARYVIELSAGEAAKNGLRVGRIVQLKTP